MSTPENVEELAEADIAAGNLGEPMTTEQVREAMSKLRRLGDRSTPENVETSCADCAGSGVIDANHFGDRMMIEPCVKCYGTGRVSTPDNVESQ